MFTQRLEKNWPIISLFPVWHAHVCAGFTIAFARTSPSYRLIARILIDDRGKGVVTADWRESSKRHHNHRCCPALAYIKETSYSSVFRGGESDGMPISNFNEIEAELLMLDADGDIFYYSDKKSSRDTVSGIVRSLPFFQFWPVRVETVWNWETLRRIELTI